MQLFIIAALLGFIFFVLQAIQKKQPSTGAPKTETIEELPNANTPLPIAGAYQKKWLLTYNEKDAFKKIKAVTDEISCYTFSKVRLLDLLEPVKGNTKYKTYFYKVQAKHVDFVILDEKLVARCVVELMMPAMTPKIGRNATSLLTRYCRVSATGSFTHAP